MSSKARCCSGVGSVNRWTQGASGSEGNRHRWRARVPRCAISVSRLCSGNPSSVRRFLFFRLAESEPAPGLAGLVPLPVPRHRTATGPGLAADANGRNRPAGTGTDEPGPDSPPDDSARRSSGSRPARPASGPCSGAHCGCFGRFAGPQHVEPVQLRLPDDGFRAPLIDPSAIWVRKCLATWKRFLTRPTISV